MRRWGVRLAAGMAAAAGAGLMVELALGAAITAELAARPSAAQGRREVLFNGRDLGGWYTFLQGPGKNTDPQGVFKVENGALHVSGQTFGYVSTVKDYENFRVSVDFKWGQKKWPPRQDAVRDAGLLYYVQGPDMVWANSLECQIQEADVGDMYLIPGAGETPSLEVLGAPFGSPTRAYVRVVKWKDYERPSGEWNTVSVVARGPRVEHWVNGKVNLIGRRASSTRGRIQLQSEGAEIYYRNIVLEHLP